MPCGDDGIDSGVVRGDAHLPAAAPCRRTDVGVFEVLPFEEFAGDIVEFLDGVRDLEVQDFGGAVEALVVFLEAEDSAVVCALAFEDEAGVVEAVRDGVSFGVAPGDELSIEPDGAVSVVEGDHGAFSGVLVVIFIVACVVVFIKCVWRCVYVEVVVCGGGGVWRWRSRGCLCPAGLRDPAAFSSFWTPHGTIFGISGR